MSSSSLLRFVVAVATAIAIVPRVEARHGVQFKDLAKLFRRDGTDLGAVENTSLPSESVILICAFGGAALVILVALFFARSSRQLRIIDDRRQQLPSQYDVVGGYMSAQTAHDRPFVKGEKREATYWVNHADLSQDALADAQTRAASYSFRVDPPPFPTQPVSTVATPTSVQLPQAQSTENGSNMQGAMLNRVSASYAGASASEAALLSQPAVTTAQHQQQYHLRQQQQLHYQLQQQLYHQYQQQQQGNNQQSNKPLPNAYRFSMPPLQQQHQQQLASQHEVNSQRMSMPPAPHSSATGNLVDVRATEPPAAVFAAATYTAPSPAQPEPGSSATVPAYYYPQPQNLG